MSELRPTDLTGKRIAAVLNSASGGCDAAAPERMRDILARAGHAGAHVEAVDPKGVERALRAASRAADVLLVLGGDGTIRSAAAACAESRAMLIPLAGGTMNMLPRALYGERAWPEALADTLAAPSVRTVSGGRVGTEMFFCAAVLGAPSLWAQAREAMRRIDLIEAVRRSLTAFRRSATETLDYRLDTGANGSAEALAVICPLISRAMTADEPSLETAVIEPVAAASLFRLAFHALFDDWRRDPAVSMAKVRRLEASAGGRVPVILDGETVRLGRRVTVSFVADAFHALVPASAP